MAKSKEKKKAEKMMDVLDRIPLDNWKRPLEKKANTGDVKGIMNLVINCIAKASREEGKARQLRNQLEEEGKGTFETLLPELWEIFSEK